MKCTKPTHDNLRGNTDKYISVNNILGIKFCFAVESTSEDCGLSDEGCGLWLWVTVKAGKGHGGGCS